MDQQAFIEKVAPIAVELYREGGVLFPSVRIAQAMLETGSQLHPWNNLVGLKASAGSGQTNAYWQGQTITKQTWEVVNGQRQEIVTQFRKYDSIEDGFKDQDLLFQSERYRRVREADTPEEQAKALVQAGYATDPAYSDKIIDIVKRYNLTRFDPTGNKDTPPSDGSTSIPDIQSRADVVEERSVEGYLIQNSLYVPIRFIANATDAEIRWDHATRTVYLEKP